MGQPQMGATWRFQDNDPDTDWIGGSGLESNLSAPLFGSLTSEKLDSGANTGGDVFNAIFDVAGPEAALRNWPTGADEPHLFIHEQTTGAGAQTRFATLENNQGAGGTSYGAPQLIVDFTPVPEPSTALLGGLAALGLIRRRRG